MRRLLLTMLTTLTVFLVATLVAGRLPRFSPSNRQSAGAGGSGS